MIIIEGWNMDEKFIGRMEDMKKKKFIKLKYIQRLQY